MGFRIAILISGRGSNMQNIIKACKSKKLASSVSLVVSNKKDADGLAIAKKMKINCYSLDDKNLTKSEFENQLEKILYKNNINFICLAGFMKVLSKDFVNKWPKKIINIHPSLLPSFKGLNPQKMALDAKVKYTGCTVHFVNDKIDDGEIIDQEIVYIDKDYNIEILKKKILKKEHKLYIKVIRTLEINNGKD